MVVKTGMLEHVVLMYVRRDILAKTVYRSVLLTVNLTHVNTRTDGALAVQDGRVITVQKLVSSPMAKIVGTHAVCNVIITHVTELMEDASLAVKIDFMVSSVKEKMC